MYGDERSVNNLVLSDGNVVIVTGPLEESAALGVKIFGDGSGVFARGTESYALTEADLKHFSCDSESLSIALNDKGEAELAPSGWPPQVTFTVTFDAGGRAPSARSPCTIAPVAVHHMAGEASAAGVSVFRRSTCRTSPVRVFFLSGIFSEGF